MAFAPRWTPEAEVKFRELQAAALASLQNRQKDKKAKGQPLIDGRTKVVMIKDLDGNSLAFVETI